MVLSVEVICEGGEDWNLINWNGIELNIIERVRECVR